MKFYYNNELIRTSKNHEYTHAVIDTQTGRCLGCRTSAQACESIISSEISRHMSCIEDENKMLKALESGKRSYRTSYRTRNGMRSWTENIDPKITIEQINEWIDSRNESINYIRNNWKIVELERRG